MPLGPATNLDEIYRTILLQPLITDDEYDAYYRGEVNVARGEDKVARMAHVLSRSYGTFYKSFLIGHSGVGKSTEMTRLSRAVADKYRVIRFSAVTDLDSAGFRPFDVLLIMIIKLVERTAAAKDDGGVGAKPSDALLGDIVRWFDTEKRTYTSKTATEAEASGGLKTSSTLLQKVLGLFVDMKGEIKYAADRKVEVTEYRLSSIADLVSLLNRALAECNRMLQDSAGCEWLFIGEDFDKPAIPNALIEDLFIDHASIFSDLKAHLIFSIPVALAYSEKAARLPLTPVCVPDTPVFNKDQTPNNAGREALRAVLEARISAELFDEGQMMRLIVASGGNLRDLFDMVLSAGTSAAIRSDRRGPINERDVTAAINEKRSEYLVRLGTSPYDDKEVTYQEKAERLVSIYEQRQDSYVPDAALLSLLRARVVQEFNGERWFGVHPLVVEILKANGRLKPQKPSRARKR